MRAISAMALIAAAAIALLTTLVMVGWTKK
jgi:hypothetical protein